jgi:hypothetical protein
MDAAYERCSCVPGVDVSDATAPTSEELYEPIVEPDPAHQNQVVVVGVSEKRCSHCVAISDIVKKMRRRDVAGGSNFFAQECGRGLVKQKTAQLVKKIEAVAVFKSRKHLLTANKERNPNLSLKPSEDNVRSPCGKVNFLRGLILREETTADKRDQQEREQRHQAEKDTMEAMFPNDAH